jgi:hypothetical protein
MTIGAPGFEPGNAAIFGTEDLERRDTSRRDMKRPKKSPSLNLGRGAQPAVLPAARSVRPAAPCCLIVEGVVIALADDPDGMAVVREDQVVRI